MSFSTCYQRFTSGSLKWSNWVFLALLVFGGQAQAIPIYVSTTIDRGPTDSLSSANRLAGVPIDLFIDGVLKLQASTTAFPPGSSTQADQFGTAQVGQAVIACVAGDVAGYSFDSVTLNTGVADPSGAGRPCGGAHTVGTIHTAVVASFNFQTSLCVYNS